MNKMGFLELFQNTALKKKVYKDPIRIPCSPSTETMKYTVRYNGHKWRLNYKFHYLAYAIETVQYLLIKLGIKPLMHLLGISIFSLNNDIVRLTKIMNNLVKDLKILSFKVIFQCLKLVESFQIFFSLKNI